MTLAGQKKFLWASLMLLLLVLAFFPALSGNFVWDDDRYLTQNPILERPDALSAIWLDIRANDQYYPLVFTSFLLEKKLWGLWPMGFHLVNLLLHGFCALILWRVLAVLGVPAPWLAAALFAVHPINTESVAWVAERKNVLSGMFYMASAWCMLRWFGLGRPGEKPGPGGWYLAGFALFALALFSKTVAATLPAALLVGLWYRRGRVEKKQALQLAPFFVLALAMGLLTIWVERHHVGAMGAAWDLSPLQRVLLAGRIPWFYLGKIVWPQNLAFVYASWLPDPHVLMWWGWLLATIATLGALWIMARKGVRGPLAAALFFGGTLFPALGFFDVFPFKFSYVANHFVYLASIGPLALGTGILNRLGQALPVTETVKKTCTAGLLALLALACARESAAFKDNATLFQRSVESCPQGWMAHFNLGAVLQDEGRFQESIYHLRQAMALKGDFPEAWVNLARAMDVSGNRDQAIDYLARAGDVVTNDPSIHFHVGEAQELRGTSSLAVKHYERALLLAPDYVEAREALARQLEALGDRDLALFHYRRILELVPYNGPANQAVGRRLYENGRAGQAVTYLERAARRMAGSPGAQHDLAVAYARQGRLNEAIGRFERCLELDPEHGEAHFNLGGIYFAKGRFSEAARHFKKTATLSVNDADARFNLGLSLVEMGQYGKAVVWFEQALALVPWYDQARLGLGLCLLETGRPNQAEKEFLQVLEARPDDARAMELLKKARDRSVPEIP